MSAILKGHVSDINIFHMLHLINFHTMINVLNEVRFAIYLSRRQVFVCSE
jgi:hypothetical protein